MGQLVMCCFGTVEGCPTEKRVSLKDMTCTCALHAFQIHQRTITIDRLLFIRKRDRRSGFLDLRNVRDVWSWQQGTNQGIKIEVLKPTMCLD